MSGFLIEPVGAPSAVTEHLSNEQRLLLKKLRGVYRTHKLRPKSFNLSSALEAADGIILSYAEEKGFPNWSFRDSGERLLKMSRVVAHAFDAPDDRGFVLRFCEKWRW